MGAPVGNKNGAKQKRLVTDALRRAAAQSPEKLKQACEKILDDAANGNPAAFNTIADRLDGKPAQSVTVAGDEDNPLITRIERVVTHLKDQDS